MAVAHSQLCICRELLKHGQACQDMGRNYFERTDEERIKRHLVNRLQKLGYEVRLDKKDAA
jgi:transposase